MIPLAEELLKAPKELILTALELERSHAAVIADKFGDTACTFLAGLYRAEQVIADRLIRMVKGRLPWTWIDKEKALPWVEKRSGLRRQFYFVPAKDPETAVRRILELVKTGIPKRFGLNPIRDIQVLCAMNRGGVGARSLNIDCRRR